MRHSHGLRVYVLMEKTGNTRVNLQMENIIPGGAKSRGNQSRERTGVQLQHGKSSEVIILTVLTSWTNGKAMPFLGPSSELRLQTTPRKSWGAKKQLLLALAEGGESNHGHTLPQPSP